MKKNRIARLLILCLIGTMFLSVGCEAKNSSEKGVLDCYSEGFVRAEASEDGYATVYVPSGRDAEVLLLADPQLDPTEKYGIVGSSNERTLTFLDKLLDATQPDLIIVAGDIAMTVAVNNLSWFCKIADVIESKEIPWSFVFGNHDCQKEYTSDDVTADDILGQVSKSTLIEYVQKEYPYCLIDSSDCTSGYGNHFINIRNTKGKLLLSVCNLDCVYDEENNTYSKLIDKAQTDWYRKHILALAKTEERETVSSIAVTHVALPEAFIGWKEAFTDGKANEHYRYGSLLEGDYSKLADEDVFFSALQEIGSTKAVFFGHHHSNDASVEYGGIDLTFIQHSGMSHEYRTTHTKDFGFMQWPSDAVFDFTDIDVYGDRRGGTLVTVSQDATYTYAPVYAAQVIPDYADWAIDYDAVAEAIIDSRGDRYVIRGK